MYVLHEVLLHRVVVYSGERVLLGTVININTVMARGDAYMQGDESTLFIIAPACVGGCRDARRRRCLWKTAMSVYRDCYGDRFDRNVRNDDMNNYDKLCVMLGV